MEERCGEYCWGGVGGLVVYGTEVIGECSVVEILCKVGRAEWSRAKQVDLRRAGGRLAS